MSLIKKIVMGVVALILLTVAAIAVVIATVDPNDYRDEITQVVKEKTGRDLRLGEMELSIFPHLGLKLQNAQLSNAPGFGDAPFVAVKEVNLGVAILPLLSKQLQVDTLTLHDFRLNLQRDKTGHSNWDDLTGGAETEKEKHEKERHEGDPMEKLAALNIGGLDIRNGEIFWQDQQADQTFKLAPFNLTSGAITLGEFFHLTLQANTEITNPNLKTQSELEADIKLNESGKIEVKNLVQTTLVSSDSLPVKTLNTELKLPNLTLTENQDMHLNDVNLTYEFTSQKDFAIQSAQGLAIVKGAKFDGTAQRFESGPLQLSAELKGAQLPNGQGQVQFEVQPMLDLKAQTAALKALTLQVLNVSATGEANIQKLLDKPSVDGKLSIAQTNLRTLLKQLGMEKEALKNMSDQKTLTAFTGDLAFKADTAQQSAKLTQIRFKLDDSELKGSASLKNFDQPNIAFDLALDKINVSRYLPPKQEQKEAEKQPAAEDIRFEIPKEPLRKLTLNGTFKAGSVIYDKLNPKNIVAKVEGKNGLIQLSPLQMDMFETKLTASAKLDVRGDMAKYAFKTDAKNVPVGDVLIAFTGNDRLSGKGTVNADITSAGEKLSLLKQNLNGKAAVNLKDGAIKGFNLAQSIRQAKAKIAGEKAAGSSEELKTDFSSLVAEVDIKNGVVDTRKLLAQAPFMRITGDGQVNLVKENLDYLVKAKIVGSDKGQGGEELTELNGLTIPVKLKGALTGPKVSLDLESLLEAKAKQEVEKKIEEKKEEVQKKLEEDLKSNLLKGFKF
ncbi:AsmA family protein [Thiomicrorhabdus sp. zzn3]|uniref:AsmA family protein n=1 Tax=Thiomicrorhabdus sp. zzn3 TaxID=3039775 RepID=UPI002436B3D8|nr:AsmA family protein [Thiomicrorhabdus sp. zzn3]MDG6777743.1 AsmA family protein [Thiomicrorhabdus sp. zzn3]